jgi:hypothetical protein
MADTEEKPADSREWILEAETEYRFELDPSTTLAIKVCFGPFYPMRLFTDPCLLLAYSWRS